MRYHFGSVDVILAMCITQVTIIPPLHISVMPVETDILTALDFMLKHMLCKLCSVHGTTLLFLADVCQAPSLILDGLYDGATLDHARTILRSLDPLGESVDQLLTLWG